MIITIFLCLSLPITHADSRLDRLVNKVQVPAHIKDVWEVQLRKTKILTDSREFSMPAVDWLDWHLSPKDRRVLAYVPVNRAEITLFPAFHNLPAKEKRDLLIHLSLHTVPAVVRVSEPLLKELTLLISQNLDAVSAADKTATRLLLRDYFTQTVFVDGEGDFSMAKPIQTLSPPWPWRGDIDIE